MDYFFFRVEGREVKLAWCNSRTKGMEFIRNGWTRIDQEEYTRLETAKIERRLSVAAVRKGA